MPGHRTILLRVIPVMVVMSTVGARVPTARADDCAKVNAAFARQLKALEKLASLASAATSACAFGVSPDDARFAMVRRAAVKTYRAFIKDIATLDRAAGCARRDPSSLMHSASQLVGERIGRAWVMCTAEADRALAAMPDADARTAYGAEHGRDVVLGILRDAGFPESSLQRAP